MRPATRIERRVGETRDERVAAAEPHELAIRRADARERVVLATERDELGRAAEQLDELGRQLARARRLPTAADPGEARGEKRHGAPGKREADREHDRRRRKDECVATTQATATTSATSGGPMPRR